MKLASPAEIPRFANLMCPLFVIDDVLYMYVYTDNGVDTYIIRTSLGTVKKIDMAKAGLENFQMLSFYDMSAYSLVKESGYALRWFSNYLTGETVLARILGSSIIKVMDGPIKIER